MMFTYTDKTDVDIRLNFTELQIRGGIGDNSKIIFLISQRKHML